MSSVFAEPYAMTFIDFQISSVSDFIGKNRQVLELLPFMSVELKFSVALKVLCEGTLVKYVPMLSNLLVQVLQVAGTYRSIES